MPAQPSRNHYLVFVDESGFMLSPLRRRTWAPRGETPIIKVTEPHGRISVVGAITISPVRDHFHFYYSLLPDNANFVGSSIVTFIDSIRRKVRRKIVVLWDQIPIHQGRSVNDYVATVGDVVLEPFPPYAPELNPVDYVWSYLKYGRLANYCPKNLDELRGKLTSELSQLKRRPDLMRSFFNATGLTL